MALQLLPGFDSISSDELIELVSLLDDVTVAAGTVLSREVSEVGSC